MSGPTKKELGVASTDPGHLQEIASIGGRVVRALPTGVRFTATTARVAGKRGGDAVSQNREHMSQIGQKGGTSVSKNRDHMATIGRRGGESVSRDREYMSELGRRGGSKGLGRKKPRKHFGGLP